MNAEHETPALRVVIAYDDVAVGERVMSLVADLAKSWRSRARFRGLPWFFDLRAERDWNEVAASDEIQADVLLIAPGNPDPWPPVGQWWEEDPSRREQLTPWAVVAVIELDQASDSAGLKERQAIQAAAQTAGVSSYLPAPRDEHEISVARIHRRAEAVTPVLREILQHAD